MIYHLQESIYGNTHKRAKNVQKNKHKYHSTQAWRSKAHS
jgi:hypothetical protein